MAVFRLTTGELIAVVVVAFFVMVFVIIAGVWLKVILIFN
jgi:hypothetical protein